MGIKLTKRKGFNFFRSYYDVYNELESKEDKVAFIDALLDRQFLGVKPENLKGLAKFAYISQTNSIDAQVKGYEDKTGEKLTPTEPPAIGVSEPPTEQVEVKEEVKLQGKDKVEEKVKNNTEGVISDQLKIDPPPEKIDFIKFQKFFNDNRKNLAEVKKMTDARKKRLKSLESQYGKACLMHCVEKARDSDFLQGINSKNWLASFDWIFTPANFIKILEDNYANRQQQSGKTNAEIFNDAMQSDTAKNFRFVP